MSSQGWGSSAMAVYRQTTQVTGKATNATRNFTVARVTGAMDGRPAARVNNAGTTLITAPATANGISANASRSPNRWMRRWLEGSAATARSVTAFASNALV